MSNDIKCHLCNKVEQPKQFRLQELLASAGWTAPKGWTKTYNYSSDKLDMCCKEHKEFYDRAANIGPPAIKLVLDIFRKDNGTY